MYGLVEPTTVRVQFRSGKEFTLLSPLVSAEHGQAADWRVPPADETGIGNTCN
jgi:hypothetical protein